MPARLLINADDFGLTPGINRAIAELHSADVLKSTTLMANGPAFDDAISLARARPTLGIGCHVVLVDGRPVSAPDTIPTLLGRDGRSFRSSLLDFTQAALRQAIDPAEITREAVAQIERLQRAGVMVTHFDTHKHTHLFLSIAQPLLLAARRCGVPGVRNPFEPRWSSKRAGAPLIRRTQVGVLGRFAPPFRKLVHGLLARESMPDGTLGIAATGTLTAQVLRATLKQLQRQIPSGTYELCCHPGHLDAELSTMKTRLRSSREVEYKALLEVVPEILRSVNAPELIHYGDLTRSPRLPQPIPDMPASQLRKAP